MRFNPWPVAGVEGVGCRSNECRWTSLPPLIDYPLESSAACMDSGAVGVLRPSSGPIAMPARMDRFD